MPSPPTLNANNTPPSSWSKPKQAELQHLADLLHLFHHRNNNQHRRATWYRHFSTFRKQLNLLNLDIATLNAAPATHLERSRKLKRDVEVKGLIQRRVEVWKDVYVEKWFLAFSQVVADGRFAVLGLVLLGALAGVCETVGVTGLLEGEGEERCREAIERFGREVADGREGGLPAVGEDVGVAVRREGHDSDVQAVAERRPAIADSKHPALTTTKRRIPALEGDAPPAPPPKRSAPSVETKAVRKPKKRKKGDAIDDLFSGLG